MRKLSALLALLFLASTANGAVICAGCEYTDSGAGALTWRLQRCNARPGDVHAIPASKASAAERLKTFGCLI